MRTLWLTAVLAVLVPTRVEAQDLGSGSMCPATAGFQGSHVGAANRTAPFAQVAPSWHPAGFPRAEAPALVYLTDPDAAPPVEVTLLRLHGSGQALNGRYARVSSDRLDAPGESTAGIGGAADFRFEPTDYLTEDCLQVIEDCSPFDAVNAYYHIDRMATEFWLQRMGVEPDFQAEVVTHISGDGAFTDPPNHVMKLSAGWIFMHNAAKEDEIIYHEYSHLVAAQLGFELSIDTPVEAQALGEGYADYFAATFTGDPRLGEWVVTCPDRQNCEGPPDDTDFRTLASDPAVWNWRQGSPEGTLKYGICTRFHEGDRKCKTSWNNFVPRYTWAMIWGGFLWDVRTAVGADVADVLVLEAMSRADSATETFEEATARLIRADSRLFGNIHSEAILTAAAGRGITLTTAREAERPLVPFRVSVHPVPSGGRMRVVVDRSRVASMVVRVFDAAGRQVEQLWAGTAMLGETGIEWDASRVPPGVYFVRVDDADGAVQVVPVVIGR